MIWSMYLVAAEKQGVGWKDISGTIQNDISEGIHRAKNLYLPPTPRDADRHGYHFFAAPHVPALEHDFHQRISHPRGGSTAVQELAFTLRDGIEYVDYCIRAGL